MNQSSGLTEPNYRVLLDHLQDGIFVIENEKLVFVNQRLADILGYPMEYLIGKSFIDFITEQDKLMVLERHRARLSGVQVPEVYDLRLVTGQGRTICCALNAGLSKSQLGATVAIGSLRDVTAQRAALEELQSSKEELKSIFDHLPDVFYRTDMRGILTRVSPSCFDLLGYHPDEMLDTSLVDYYANPDDRPKIVKAIMDGGGQAVQVEAALKRKDGAVIWVSTSASMRYGPDGNPVCIEGLSRNISERKRMEDLLVTLSRTDMLTGAYNRGHFLERAEEVIGMVKRYEHSATVMMADLDHFKSINDRYGHQAGDLILETFARVCQNEIREPDIFGRLGGEEFVLMLPETPIQQALILAERIRKATSAIRIPLENRMISVTVSIGLAQIEDEERPLESALHRADQALYKAKNNGRNQVATSSGPD